jgi:uncharacterized protein YfaS (alpha-2-macroglobulin family)
MRPGGLAGVALCLLGALALTAFGVTEEVELADVTGVATHFEDDQPAARAEIHLSVYNEGADLSGLVTMRTVADKDGRFTFRNVPAGFATIRAYAPGYSSETGVVVKRKAPELSLTMRWLGDELEMTTNQPVFTPDESPKIVLHGMTRRTDIAISVFAFSDKDVFDKRDTYELTRTIAYNRGWGGQAPTSQLEPAQRLSHKIRGRDFQGKFAEVVELPKMKEGVYVVRAEVDGVARHQWINVSRLGLVTKASPKSLTGYVVDIATGEPMAGVAVSVVGPEGRRELGTTGANGTVRSHGDSDGSGSYVMLATKGGSRALAMFDRWSDSDGELAAMHVQLDRPVYRPGDTVLYKGFVRVPTPEGYRLPDFQSVQVKVLDPDGTEISSELRPVSAMGGFDGSFETIPEITGSYQIEIEVDGQTHSEYVPILAYRKPEFKITVTPVKPFYLVGENAQFKVKAEFFTGEPVVGAELDAWAVRSEVWRWSPFDDEEYEWWAYGEEVYDYGGEFIGDFKGRTDENGEAVFTVPTKSTTGLYESADLRYSLSVNGQDVSGRSFSGEGKVDVARGEIDLTVAFEDYVVAPNSAVRVRVKGQKFGEGGPAVGAKVNIEFGEQVWSGNRTRDEKKGTQTVTLDDQGEATLALRPTGDGDYFVKATTVDSGRRTIEARDSVWVYERGARFGGPAPSLQVVLDQKSYSVGENATAVIRTDKPGGSALVTVEADDVLWSSVVALHSEATSVSIPVTKATRPNASVRVCYIKEKSYAESSRSLVVDLGPDKLNVTLEPDAKEVLPGATVSYKVTTTDLQGKPVPADVSVSVVDEGVYSVREDNSDPLRSFFPNRWSSVSTYYSFPEVYFDGDDKSGAESDIRTDFRDTAHWAPSVVTGVDGTATLSVTLPDNLTSWRATATAVSSGAMAGKGRSDVIARKPLMVRVSPPAFLVQDESQTVGVAVRNETDTDQDVDVRITAIGLDVRGNTVQRLRLKQRSSGRVEWQLRAVDPGKATVRVVAAASRGGHTDGLEVKLPVRANGPTLESYSAGDTASSTKFEMKVEQGAIAGDLTISLTPSILGSIIDSLDTLVDYPYGCVEQTMSRFMPAVVVRRFLSEAGIQDPELDAKIVDVSEKSQARLRTMQRGDGGFGWWSYDGADPEMTALVLEGLYHAKQSGVDVNAHLLDRTLEWAKNFARTTLITTNYESERVRVAYALSLHGVDPSLWSRLLVDPKLISQDEVSLAYTVLAIHGAGKKLDADKAKYKDAAYRQLLSLATETESTMSWANDWWYEPTAVALMAVVKSEPDGKRAAKVLRYLTSKRRGAYWTSTRDTAQIVLAGIEYLRQHNELNPDFEARVVLNGADIGKYRFVPGNLSRAERITVPFDMLVKGTNEVAIEFSGQGRVYYSARLSQGTYDPNPRPTDSGDGLSIKREYFRMEPRRLEDGTHRLVPSRNPVTSARSGEVLHCRLTVTSDREREFVMVTDPALSNARAIDAGAMEEWEWYYWWSDQMFLDDHTALFLRYLKAGVNIVEYSVRAEAVGTSTALPATASLMYQPDVRASTGSARLEVRK